MHLSDLDSEDATRAIRYFITALTAVTIAATAPRVEPWVLRAGEKMAALMRFDKMSRPDQIVMRMTRNDGRIMFYMGYAIFLIFLMAHL